MASKSILWLWLCLFVSATLANLALPSSDSTCFASNNASPDENYEACCPHQANKPQNGAGSVSGAQFTYKCGYYPDPFGDKVDGEVSNMQDCAAHCVKDPTCVAGAWNPGCCDPKKCTPGFCGMCYLTTKMDGKKRAKGPGWVLLETALHKCMKDKEACQTAKKACDTELAETKTQLAQCNNENNKCQTDKGQITQQRDKALNDYNTCQTEKGQITQQRDKALNDYNICQATITQSSSITSKHARHCMLGSVPVSIVDKIMRERGQAFRQDTDATIRRLLAMPNWTNFWSDVHEFLNEIRAYSDRNGLGIQMYFGPTSYEGVPKGFGWQMWKNEALPIQERLKGARAEIFIQANSLGWGLAIKYELVHTLWMIYQYIQDG
jgi:hypothetical protein